MLLGILALIGIAAWVAVAVVAYVGYGLWKGGEWLVIGIIRRRRARIARIEAELDRTQDELRATVLQLANALGMEAHEARKALIRESYLASGHVPSESSDS
ncbi:hypothetical protein GCM10009819_00340 [Agromyces tropicus]|uniref:Uncharacterized protein n=1 Tax=Agromyces tropicus TaxID=555371 RepID=A0ABN2TUH4_9MICO